MRAYPSQGQADMLPEEELTLHQFRVLNLLSQGGLRLGEIADRLGTSNSSMSRVVDRLVTRDLIERITDKEDRRAISCTLSSKGLSVLQDLRRLEKKQFDSDISLLTDGELVQVVDAFEIALNAFKRGSRQKI